jgi:hypothetical protein
MTNMFNVDSRFLDRLNAVCGVFLAVGVALLLMMVLSPSLNPEVRDGIMVIELRGPTAQVDLPPAPDAKIMDAATTGG